MKDIHVCGIGHALVDIEFAVSETEFSSLGLKKGSMALVDSDQQKTAINKLESTIPHRSSGGSAANTIIAIGQFGGKAAYKTILGDDQLGEFYANEFRDLGIHLEAEIIPNSVTGTCLVLITPDAERTMMTALGVNSNYNKDHLVEHTIARSEWLYTEGYRLTEPGGAEAIKEAVEIARKNDTNIAFTFSDSFVVEVFRDRVEEIAEFTDLVFCNEVEAMSFTGTNDPEIAFDELKKRFQNVVLTRGADGAMIHYQDETVHIPSYKTTPVDTTGAGDMFAAGFMYGITHGFSAEKSGHLASFAASKIVSQFGARLKESPKSIRDEVFSKFND